MTIVAKKFLHKGLELFWDSGGTNHSGITYTWARTLKGELVHLDTATCLDDILGGLGVSKHAKLLSGTTDRYSMEVNGNWRLTFTLVDAETGDVNKIDLEDFHRAGGAKRH